MALFRSRDDKVQWNLTKAVRLLLPENPGPDRVLDAAQQYTPEAKPFRLNRETICLDGKHFFLHPGSTITPDMGMRAGLPSDITTVFLPDWNGATIGLNTKMEKQVNDVYRQKASYLLGGLGARFGGLWYPRPEDITRPLCAYIFTTAQVDQAGLAGMAARYAPGLGPADSKWSSEGVLTLRGDSNPSLVQYWPPDIAKMHKVVFAAGPGMPQVLDPSWRDEDTAVITVEADQAAEGAPPSVADAVGRVALGLAAQTGGVCVDVFAFRVRDPADLVIRAP
jgi:hypothetical protein